MVLNIIDRCNIGLGFTPYDGSQNNVEFEATLIMNTA
jgi:hypothetical protein